MSDTVVVAIITASGSALVAITALLLNYRGFVSIDSRFSSLESRFASIDSGFASIERRLDGIQSDLKEFYKELADHDKRISRLEDRP